MTAREELIEKIGDIVYDSTGAVDDESALMIAAEIVDLALPQVRTVAELEALPVGTVLLGRNGGPWWRDDYPTIPWTGKGGAYGSTHDPLALVHRWFIDDEGPLTVVWQPEVTA